MRWWFLDRIDELISGERASGRKGVASSEDYFTDHFPGFPVLPGVVQVEALAQLSGKLLEVTVFDQRGVWMWPILSMVRKAKFRRFVRPGDTVILKSTLRELREESAIVRAIAEVDGRKVSEAELLFVFNPEGLDTSQAQLDLETLERKNLKMLWDDYEAWANER